MATMVFKFRVSCLIALLPLGSLEFICPGAILPLEGLWYASIEPNVSGRASQEYTNIRIKPIYDPTIEGKPNKELVQQAVDFWANALSVKPVDGRIFIRPKCKSEKDFIIITSKESGVKEAYCLGSCVTSSQCQGFQIPKEHLDGCRSCKENGKQCSKDDAAKGTGVENADLVFYVNAINTEHCLNGKTVAYATPCEVEYDRFRPLFALINICPGTAAKLDSNNMLKVIKHEMMHALGFGFHMLFRDKDGQPLWPSYENGLPNMNNDVQPVKVLKTVERDWHVRGGVIKSSRTFLITPRVVEEVRAHFNCQDLEGAELEDFGRNGTRHGHLEARVFYDDEMRGDTLGKGLFSRIDFAVLEDSGWYQVDYSQAEEMDFGKKLGCDFCMKRCKFWMDKKRKEGKCVEPYCDTPDFGYSRGITCIGPKRLFTGCPLTKLGPGDIPELLDPSLLDTDQLRKYQHFDQIYGVYDSDVPLSGSFDTVADCCPVPFKNWDATERLGNGKCGMEPNLPRHPNNPCNPNPYPRNPNPGWNPNNPRNPNPGWNPNNPRNPNPGWNPNNPRNPNPGWNPNNPRNPNPGWNPNNPRNPNPGWNPNNPRNPNPGWNPNNPENPYPYPLNPYPWLNPTNPGKPNPTASQNPTTTSNPKETPNPTSKPWEETSTSTLNPAEEAKDDEDEASDSSLLGSSTLLSFLFSIVVILL